LKICGDTDILLIKPGIIDTMQGGVILDQELSGDEEKLW
jgi:hypothetical protein